MLSWAGIAGSISNFFFRLTSVKPSYAPAPVIALLSVSYVESLLVVGWSALRVQRSLDANMAGRSDSRCLGSVFEGAF